MDERDAKREMAFARVQALGEHIARVAKARKPYDDSAFLIIYRRKEIERAANEIAELVRI